MTNYKKLIESGLLFFDKTKGILKIDQSRKNAVIRHGLSMGLAYSYSSSPDCKQYFMLGFTFQGNLIQLKCHYFVLKFMVCVFIDCSMVSELPLPFLP